MKKINLTVVLFLMFLALQAQPKADIGVFAGFSYCLSDVNPTKQFYSKEFAFGGMYKYNFNNRYSLRASIINGKLSGNDKDFGSGYQQSRNYSFSTSITDFTTQVEFNFLPYSVNNEREMFSPYIATGLTLYVGPATGSGAFQFAIPMGLGLKLRLSDRWSAGAEWSFRKTFTNYLDKLEAEFTDGTYQNKQKSITSSNDWYSFGGIFLTYKFYTGKNSCSAYPGNFNSK